METYQTCGLRIKEGTTCFFWSIFEIWFTEKLLHTSVISGKQLCCKNVLLRKISVYINFSSPYFPVLGLNTKIYQVNLHNQSEYVIVIARCQVQYGKYFPKSSHFSTYFANNSKIWETGKIFANIARGKRR